MKFKNSLKNLNIVQEACKVEAGRGGKRDAAGLSHPAPLRTMVGARGPCSPAAGELEGSDATALLEMTLLPVASHPGVGAVIAVGV